MKMYAIAQVKKKKSHRIICDFFGYNAKVTMNFWASRINSVTWNTLSSLQRELKYSERK